MNILTLKDIDNINSYGKLYNIEVPNYLLIAMKSLEKEINESPNGEVTTDNVVSENVKIQLCIWLTTENHFQNDSLWAPIAKKAKEFLEVTNVSK